ncbi:MAG: hypothetical protein K0S94_2812 [Nitrospira sp.]|jgi:hypothetical protein|nr:hypothetical protein [Nitrospira sp.]
MTESIDVTSIVEALAVGNATEAQQADAVGVIQSLIRDHSDLVRDYNDLVDRYSELQKEALEVSSFIETMKNEIRAVQAEGEEAALSGKPATECPYRAGSTEARLWVHGFENPPLDEGDDEEDPDDESLR